MGIKKKKNKSFKLYESDVEDFYRIMPKLKKRDFTHINDKNKLLYYLRVWYVTEIQPLHKLINYSKRCWGRSGCYELDHILPISYSYLENIPPHLVGSIDNLRFISKEENRSKGFKLNEDSHKILRKFKSIR